MLFAEERLGQPGPDAATDQRQKTEWMRANAMPCAGAAHERFASGFRAIVAAPRAIGATFLRTMVSAADMFVGMHREQAVLDHTRRRTSRA